MTPKNLTAMRERFDEKFTNLDYCTEAYEEKEEANLGDEIKNLIESEITQALAEREEEIVKMIYEMKIPNEAQEVIDGIITAIKSQGTV